MARLIQQLTQQEQLNFLLTNRIPRRLATRLVGWYSRIRSPLLTRLTLWLWQKFAGPLDLHEAARTEFDSLQACFIRELKPGMRPIDEREHVVVSPCDAIVGACGRVQDGLAFQAKGYPYALDELIPEPHLQAAYRNGCYVTLRLRSTMYHRFHAPLAAHVSRVNYISGDTWNVNPIALKRIEKLFCRNERAVIQLHTQAPHASITLVPVAAILVASMQFHCLPFPLDLSYGGEHSIPCNASYQKGQEMGYFQQGSTILVFAGPEYTLCDQIQPGATLKMGQALLQLTDDHQPKEPSHDLS